MANPTNQGYATFKASASKTAYHLESAEMYISKFEVESSTATLVLATGVFTDATPQTFTVDALISVVKKNFWVLDDNNKLCWALITDNDASTITIAANMTTCTIIDTEVAGAFTDGETYTYCVLEAHDTSELGNWMGYVNNVSFERTEEKIQHKNGVPRSLEREDLLEATGSATFDLLSTERNLANAIYNAIQYGEETLYYKTGTGFNPGTKGFYEVVMVSDDINAKALINRLLKVQLSPNGAVDKSSEEYKVIPTMVTCFSHSLVSAAVTTDAGGAVDMAWEWREK